MARLTFLLLLLWVGSTVSTVVDLQKRIFNGRNCSHQDRLYHVGLSDSATGVIHCGGSRIHKEWVLTAAHCQKPTMYAVVDVHPGPGTTVKIEGNPVVYLDHDIMLLKLPRDIPGSKNILISLPDDGECKSPLKTGEVVGVAGYGLYQIDKKTGKAKPGQPTHLQCATLKVVKCDTKKTRAYRKSVPDDYWLCAEKKDTDTCPGDSGGGVEYNGKLHGVISANSDNVCMLPALFLNVCKYKQWIEEKTK